MFVDMYSLYIKPVKVVAAIANNVVESNRMTQHKSYNIKNNKINLLILVLLFFLTKHALDFLNTQSV